jgi:hypothetical protein
VIAFVAAICAAGDDDQTDLECERRRARRDSEDFALRDAAGRAHFWTRVFQRARYAGQRVIEYRECFAVYVVDWEPRERVP